LLNRLNSKSLLVKINSTAKPKLTMKSLYQPTLLLILAGVLSASKATTRKAFALQAIELSRSEKEVILCRITTVHTHSEHGNKGAELQSELACIPIVQGRESGMVLPVVFPKGVERAKQKLISDGHYYVSLQDAKVAKNELIMGRKTQFEQVENAYVVFPKKVDQTFGIKTVMLVRVSTSDGVAPTHSLNDMRIALTYFRNQYEACSFGKLKWIDAGGMEVTLDKAFSSYTGPAQLLEDAQAQVVEDTGLGSAADLADHVIFVEPPGLGPWVATAPVNHWRVHINDDYVLSLSTREFEVNFF
jgi:hypothetical protein